MRHGLTAPSSRTDEGDGGKNVRLLFIKSQARPLVIVPTTTFVTVAFAKAGTLFLV